MATVTKPFWWDSVSAFYGFPGTPGTSIDTSHMLSRLNTYLVPNPSQYETHLKTTVGSAPSTTKLDFTVLGGGNDFISAQAGADYVTGAAAADVIFGDAGHDIIRGGANNDLLIGSNEADLATDRDTLSYRDAAGAITALLNTKTTYVTVADGSYDMVVGFENVIGSDFADRIDGQDGVDNTVIGGLGADRLYGGSGKDNLTGDAGDDRLYGEEGADILIGGKGRDSLYLGLGADVDRIIMEASILGDIANNRDNIYEFQAGPGGDKFDVSSLLRAVGYNGTNAIADGYIKLTVSGGDDIKVQFDRDGATGSAAAQHLATILDTPLANFTAADNIVMESRSILYTAVLGQSNAKGLSTSGADGESGITRLKAGLAALTDYDEIYTVQRDNGSPIDIAVGGTTVDGNRNANYTSDLVWWYPDQNKPGEVLLRAVDILATQMADLRARGDVTPVFIWGQGEAETRLLGKGPDYQAAVDRYIQATYNVFDYLKAHLGDDIKFFIMQTGRYNDDAARLANESEREIAQVQRGLDLLYTAQEDMALARDDIFLAANYSDLHMLHESDPVMYPTDVWHMDYDDREIMGDRLAGFIAAELGTSHVIANPGSYPVRALADLTIHAASASEPSVINGTAGADRLVGTVMGSKIYGGAGDDKLIASGGNNTLNGGVGKDSLTASSGQDTIVFGADILPDVSSNADFINGFQAGAGGDRIDISALLASVGYAGDDPIADGYFKLVADGTRTKLQFDANGPGGAGARYLATLADVNINNFSAEHNLIIHPEENPPAMTGLDIAGTAAPDLIIGTMGNDIIHGDSGDDMIVAGAGSDILYGDEGINNFIFDATVWDESFEVPLSGNLLEFADILEDFTVGEGGDTVNVEILLEKAGLNDDAGVYISMTDDGNGNAILAFDADGGGAGEAVALAVLTNVPASGFSLEHNIDRPAGTTPIV